MSPRRALLMVAVALAACGQTPEDRALSGGAVGAGAGALTSPNQIDLGRPAWEQ